MRVGAYGRCRAVLEHDCFAIRIVASHDSSNPHNVLRSREKSTPLRRFARAQRRAYAPCGALLILSLLRHEPVDTRLPYTAQRELAAEPLDERLRFVIESPWRIDDQHAAAWN